MPMPESRNERAELAFGPLIEIDEVEFILDQGDLHIAADDWTLVLEGDPVTNVIIAIDDEDGSPEHALREAISEDAFAAMRAMDAQMDGVLIAILNASPDTQATTLAALLQN